jgi:hypothetical protein
MIKQLLLMLCSMYSIAALRSVVRPKTVRNLSKWNHVTRSEYGRLLTSASRPLCMSSTDEAEVVADMPDTMPSSFDSQFLQTLYDRGFIHQCTDFKTLDAKCSTEIVPAYLGFDATAPSLHVGSLLQIMILRHLQQSGHKPIILIGGGTTKVGDPTGKDLQYCHGIKYLQILCCCALSFHCGDDEYTNMTSTLRSFYSYIPHFPSSPSISFLLYLTIHG